MQTKTTRKKTNTTVRSYPTPVRKPIIKKSAKNKCWRGVEKREPSDTAGGDVSRYGYYGDGTEVPQKTKNRITK